jgi:integrase/recombinase XerC
MLDGETKVEQVTRKLIRRFLARLHEGGTKATSIRRKLAAVKSFCKWLENEGLLDAGLLQTLSGPRRRDELPDVPGEAEIKRLLEGEIPTACPERDRVVLELLYGSGLRVSELCGINVDDFRDEDALLVRGKGRRERLVVFGEYAQAAIREWLPARVALLVKMKFESGALLFSISPNHTVERLDVRSIRRILIEVAKAKGLPDYNPHLLRHACASHLHDHGAPLQAIATLLGHAKLSTAQIYTRVSVGRMMDTYNRAHPHARIAD